MAEWELAEDPTVKHSSINFLSGHLLLFQGRFILRLDGGSPWASLNEREVTRGMRLTHPSWTDHGNLPLGLALEIQKE